MRLISHLCQIVKSSVKIPLQLLGMQEAYDHNEDWIESRPPASLVPVPIHFLAESAKEQLAGSEYRYCLRRRSGEEEEDQPSCIVCMGCIEAIDEVRETSSCHHVFHRECLEGWIDHGHIICPLCKSNLLPNRREDQGEGDPWRRERMIYLFGEDYTFNTSN